MTTASIAYGAAPAALCWDDVLARYTDQVRKDPSAPAVVDGELTCTYGELDALAERTAEALRDRVRPGDLVGVCLDRSVALVATAVALARLGAVYLPLGPRPGERRLAAVTDRLRVTCLIGTAEVLPRAYRPDQTPLPLPEQGANAGGPALAAFPAEPSAAALRTAPEGAFYAVLTSGSTGTPKAVAVTGPALAHRLRWYAGRTVCGPGDRHSLLVGPSFDPHLMELWTALTSGAALTVPPDAVRWDPDILTDWWRSAGVTVSILPTPLAELVMERPWPRDLPLRHLQIGGDRLRRRPGVDVTAQVDNAYGPAEAAVLVTTHELTGAAEDGLPPIGSPVAGVALCVTDGEGRVVPRGEEGELRVGGAGLALGYLDEELTARRFVAPPPELSGTDRVYRTGDRVRMREDGVLEFLGRLDEQLKIRGVRIEPAEIEAAFERDPRILRAAVAVKSAERGGSLLIAFVRPAPGQEAPGEAELLESVREWLPEQAVPSTVRYVDAFPLDANGKVDRAALLAERHPEPAAAQPAEGSEGSPTEELVVGLCRELLGNPEIGPGDNFLGTGGDSLTAARLLTALEEECGVRLRAPQLLRQPDLRAIAALLDNAARPASGSTPQGSGATDPQEKRSASETARPGGVLGRIIDHAADTPEALAVWDGTHALTYRELTAAAQRLATTLRHRGVTPGTAVGLLLPHSVSVVVAKLAVWWAGGHYVPLDAAYPRARTETMLADSEAVLVVGQKDLLEAAGIAAGRSLAVAAGGVPETGPEEILLEPCSYDPDALAYVMYTSGSTGRPKGVAIPQRAVAELTVDPDYVTVTARDRVLFHSPLTFDASPFEVWVALANGAAVVVSTADRQSLESLGRDVERLGVTVALLTAALFHHLAARGSSVFAVLRTLLVGGEALSAPHARAVLREYPWLELVNGYGPTEATTFATCHRVREADCDGPPPIGRPVAGATAHVLDERGEPLPPGARGELWLGGSRLARGYLRQPERTAESFVEHPSLGPLYRTGDLASVRPDGVLEFHGRLDDQVKVRGYRIEPGEIEHALRSHPQVSDAAVAVVRHDAGDARLTAFVVPADGARPTPAELRDHLADRLPPHLLPNAWSVVTELPLTSYGKVDRHALAELPPTGGTEAPAGGELTPIQRAVTDAWEAALEREVADPEADFLALGGHSLLALGIVDDLREDLGVDLPLAAFFSSPTVAGQARLIEDELAKAYGTETEGAR